MQESTIKRWLIALLSVVTLGLTTCAGEIASRDAETRAADAVPSTTAITNTPVFQPVAGLTGRLIYTSGPFGSIRSHDLATNQVSVLYQPPVEGSFISATAASPEHGLIALAYAPAQDDDTMPLGYTDLYVLPIDEPAEPELLLRASDQRELYGLPSWSPDGAYLYFNHITGPNPDVPSDYLIRIERIAYPDGEPEIIAENAFWPKVSPDGTMLAYLAHTTETDELMLVNNQGGDARQVIPTGRFLAVDALTFSPDGAEILFSAVNPASTNLLNWWEALLMPNVARAHDVPSDLWKVPVAGGEPIRLTTLNDVDFYPAYSPDGQYIAFICSSGIFVMKADGTEMTQIHASGPSGTLDWIP